MRVLRISAANAEYQIIESLKTNRSKRFKHKEIFIEGIEPIKQAILAKMEISRIIFTDMERLSGWAKQLIAACSNSKIIEMSDNLYKNLSDRHEPTEIIVTVKVKSLTLENAIFREKPFVLICDRPSDHGNFGSIIRSANSFNVDAVFIIGHGIDYYDPKVIRSSLGSIFHTQVIIIESMEQLNAWVRHQKINSNIKVIGTDSTGTVSLLDDTLKVPIALILGNEAKGMSVALKETCDYITKIPISGNVNSLNISCACSIFLWDIYKNSYNAFT